MNPASPLWAAAPPQGAAAPVGLRVALCGPIAPPGEPAGGGYEAANRRTSEALRQRGVEVLELRYPRAQGGALRKALAYAATFVRLAWAVVAQRSRYDLLHLTPLNMHFALFEHLLMRLAGAAGRPVLMDVRAGTFVRHYQGRGAVYRRLIDASLRRAARVAVEGEGYLDFVGQRQHAAALYFPNFVENVLLDQPGAQARPGERRHPVRLLVLGRLVPEKGVATALEAARCLARLGWPVSVDLVGQGPAAQVQAWRSEFADVDAQWHGALGPSAMRAVVARSHFFVFASRHDGEGHSNALNETMACGVVPVCSDQGFSAAVVGLAGRVLPGDAGPADYAGAMAAVLAAGQWPFLSAAARERVRLRFSESAALPALLAAYQGMLQDR